MLSRNYFLRENNVTDLVYMKKLNQKKVRWIVREMKKGDRSVNRIAKIMGETSRWVREIYRVYHRTGQYPYPGKPGRKSRPVSIEERILILDVRSDLPISGAVAVEKILDSQGFHISHNWIHKFLKEEGFEKEEPHKQKRRKWIRHERRYSNSLWHADWFEEKQDKIIVFQDDASRFITGYGIFTNATAKNTNLILEQALTSYGIPKQLMTDHGTQFTSLPRESCKDPNPNKFQKILLSYGIKHIKARVKHPQSNGKVERNFLLFLPQPKEYLNNRYYFR